MSGDTSMFHGGGNNSLSTNDITSLSNMSNIMNDPHTNPQVVSQLQQQQGDMLNRDNGGYVGALGRIATGTGQTGGEKAIGALAPMVLGLFRNLAAAQALRNSNNNMMNAQNQSLNNQRGMVAGTGFYNK